MTGILKVFDCDGVKADFFEPYLEFVNSAILEKIGINPGFKVEDIDNYNFELKSPRIMKKAARVGLKHGWFVDYLRVFSRKSFYASLPLIPGSKKAVEHFKGNNSDIAVVTARVDSLKRNTIMTYDELLSQKKLEHKIQEDTFLWYNFRLKNLFDKKDIYFINGNSKQDVIRGFEEEYQHIILIEDNYRNALDNMSNKGNYSFLLNRRYNPGPTIDGLVRINGYKRDKFDTESQFQELVEKVDDLTKKLTS